MTELQELIKDWNLHCESITLASLLCFSNKKLHCINSGQAGIGKSRSTVELANALELPFIKVVSGHITPKAFFQLLQSHPEDTIIVDESATELANPETLTLLRSALFGRKVTWASNDSEETIEFRGNIILNTNKLPRSIDSTAVLDRCLTTITHLTVKQLIQKMRQASETNDSSTTKQAFVSNLKKVVLAARNNQEVPSREEFIRARTILESRSKNKIFDEQLSMRRQQQLAEVQKTWKQLCGETISDETINLLMPGNNLKELLKQYKTTEVIKYLITTQKISRATAYRRIEQCEAETSQ